MLCFQQDVKMMCSADLEQDVIPLLVRLQTARRLVPWLLEALIHLHPHIHAFREQNTINVGVTCKH